MVDVDEHDPVSLTIHAVSGPEDRGALIAHQVHESVYDVHRAPYLRRLVIREMLRGVRDRDDLGQLGAMFRWIQREVRFIEDPAELDWFPQSLMTLWQGGEDCDGHTILACSCLAMVGFRVGCRIIHTKADEWHVYALAGLPKGTMRRIVAFDTTWQRSRSAGDEYPTRLVVPGHTWSWMFDLS